MKKLILLSIIVFNFLLLPSAVAKDQVVIDRITKSEAEDLNIVVPDDVPPGFHSVTIEVYDDQGTVSQKQIEFCKDELGDVQWDNNCPNLSAFLAKEPVAINNKPGAIGKSYDPLKDPETTKGLHIAGFALLAALTSVKRNKPDEEQESLQSLSSGKLKLLKEEPGRGDLSQSWVHRSTAKTDNLFIKISGFFNRFSPLLTRTVQDGNTLRAIFGSFAAFLAPLGLVLGLAAAIDTGGQALPPTLILLMAIMGVAIFDAFAGLIAGAVFFLAAAVTFHITNRTELLSAIGVVILFFAPALLASSFRPFRRLIANQDDLWDRITDYALTTLLTYWVITKMVGAMNGLARTELKITEYSTELGIFAATLLLIRIGSEDIAVEHYPVRLSALHVEIRNLNFAQEIRSKIMTIFIFFIMAAPFVGSTVNLLLGTILFAIPQLTSLALEDRIPKIKIYLASGALKIVVMVFVMAALSSAVKGLFPVSADFIKWSFVIMALPSFILHYLGAISDSPDNKWKFSQWGRIIYRLIGIAVFILLFLIVRGVDITSWLIK